MNKTFTRIGGHAKGLTRTSLMYGFERFKSYYNAISEIINFKSERLFKISRPMLWLAALLT